MNSQVVASDEVELENKYHAVQRQLLDKSKQTTLLPEKITVDAITDLLLENPQPNVLKRILRGLRNLNLERLELADQVRLAAIEFRISGETNLKEHVEASINETFELDIRTSYELERAYDAFPEVQNRLRFKSYGRAIPYNEIKSEALQELFFKKPRVDLYKKGAYSKVPRLFMFCSHQRNYPCLMLLKDHQDNPVYLADGKSLWSQPSLGYTANGKPFSERSGYTPSGVYEINSVMPSADQQTAFGKYRRLIVDFVPKSQSEVNIARLVHQSALTSNWWKEGTFARDIGRNLLRIHGTGRSADSSPASYKPFVATSGCIAQRENAGFIDQRHLLDALMNASGLDAKFANETGIKALLYVIEVSNEKKAITLQYLNSLGLKAPPQNFANLPLTRRVIPWPNFWTGNPPL
jgi:hypothetical protein